MLKQVNVIEVEMGGLPVGKLAMAQDNLCAFEYDIAYLKSGVSISPFYLPLKPGVFIGKR